MKAEAVRKELQEVRDPIDRYSGLEPSEVLGTEDEQGNENGFEEQLNVPEHALLASRTGTRIWRRASVGTRLAGTVALRASLLCWRSFAIHVNHTAGAVALRAFLFHICLPFRSSGRIGVKPVHQWTNAPKMTIIIAPKAPNCPYNSFVSNDSCRSSRSSSSASRSR